ncbi:MAG: prepilin-type N-terminal cleavage/methylation domain-containing protein [Candidatus Omnitrophica bacterium]|nr:prepilin-type N-terminal cleavage/methylation domain-containing protein [Candidatus Omnitrophota bacterium]MDD5546660.1 prepilin-type N-terminal cleavage/methylation domain-containing protein [Candidatus Omnitrophota bacterium]
MRISSQSSRRSARRKGLTLIEILVVSVIFSIIATSLFIVFKAGLDSWRRTQGHLEIYQNARASLDMMTRDLSAAYLNSGNADITFRGFASGSGSTWVTPSGGSEVFFVAALNPTQNDPNVKFELCQVGYWLNSTTHELTRYYYPQLASPPDYDFSAHAGDAGQNHKIADNVVASATQPAFSLTFFDSAGTQTTTWDSRAGGAQAGQKPSKVQIILTIQEPNSTKTQTFSTGVYIP